MMKLWKIFISRLRNLLNLLQISINQWKTRSGHTTNKIQGDIHGIFQFMKYSFIRKQKIEFSCWKKEKNQTWYYIYIFLQHKYIVCSVISNILTFPARKCTRKQKQQVRTWLVIVIFYNGCAAQSYNQRFSLEGGEGNSGQKLTKHQTTLYLHFDSIIIRE